MRIAKTIGRSNGGVLAVLVVLVVLLPLLVFGVFVQHGHDTTNEDRALEFEAERQTASVVDYFASARSLTQILASTPKRSRRQLDISPQQLVDVKRAASLHDIGKLAIPESILSKEAPVTHEEWQFVRQHTLIGQRVLGAAPSLSRCGSIARASHEAWDGTGYPDGLAGEAIPLEARVIAVCDAYEAMTSERPYAQARRRVEAVAELQRCAGTQFDPAVVGALPAALSGVGASLSV